MENISNLPQNYFSHHNDILSSRMKLTENELDMIYIITAQLDSREQSEFKKIEFTISELEAKTNKKWNDTRVKQSLKALNTKPIEIIHRNEKGRPTGAWEVYYWLTSIKHKNGVITVGINNDIKPYLLQLKGAFETIPLGYILKLSGSYSKRIYTLMKQTEKTGHRKFNLEELQEMLKVPKSLKVYADFKRKVLEPAINEINKYSDIEISYEETKKERKKVIEITFTIRKNRVDLEIFIDHIKKNSINLDLLTKGDGELIRCDRKGILFNAKTMTSYPLEQQAKIWELLFENRNRLLYFQPTLF